MPRATLPRLLAAGVILHLALYARGLSGGFTFDDRKVVLQDAAVSGRAPLSSVLLREFLPRGRPEDAIYFRPLTLLSLGLDARLFGLTAGAMRLENVLLAGLGAGLFAGLASALGGSAGVAWGTLLLTCCHPVRSEAVLSIVVRSDLLVLTLVGGALLAAVRALSGHMISAAVSGGLVCLAFFAKENAFVAPAFLLLVALAVSWRTAIVARGARALAASWTLALLAGLGVRWMVLGGVLSGSSAALDPIDNLLVTLPAPERVRAALALVPLAGARLLFPATLAADYGSASFSARELLRARAWVPGACVLLGVSALAAFLLRRRSLAGVGLAWVLVAYLPFANLLFPTPVAFAERLLYVPAAGLGLAVASALAHLGPRRSAAAILLLAFLGTARIEGRIPEWRDDRSLFSAVVRDVPGNGRIWLDLALYSLSEGDLERARAELTSALRADPRLLPSALQMLAHAERIGNASAAAAIRAAMTGANRRP